MLNSLEQLLQTKLEELERLTKKQRIEILESLWKKRRTDIDVHPDENHPPEKELQKWKNK